MALNSESTNTNENRPGEKISIKSKPTLLIAAIIFGIGYIVLTCILDNSSIKGVGHSCLVLLKDICQLVVTSIAVTAIISISDLQDVYGQMEKKVIAIVNSVLKEQVQCCAHEMSSVADRYGAILGEHEIKFNYVSDPQTMPYDIMSDENLNTLIKSAVCQKTENTKMKIDSQIREAYTEYIDELQDVYIGKLMHMGKGYINKSYSRRITITPDNANRSLLVETYIELSMYIPQEFDKKQYTYAQKFRTEEEAGTLKITDCHLNGHTVDCRESEIYHDGKNKIFPFYREVILDFEVGKTNALVLQSTYRYNLGEETSFSETYYVTDACKDYVFEVQLNGKDAQTWNVQAVWSEEKQASNVGKSLGYDSDSDLEEAKRISVSTKDERWVMEGTAINVYVRKVSDND